MYLLLEKVFNPAFSNPILDPTCGVKPPLSPPAECVAATREMQTEAIAFALTSGTQLPVSALAPVQ